MTATPPNLRNWTQQMRAGRLENGTIWRLHLTSASTAGLTQSQAEATVLSYIDPTHLVATAQAKSQSQREVFADLLPTKPHLKSGDFGEILTTTDLSLRTPFPRFPLFRWRLRSNRNDTVRGLDLLGMAQSGSDPSSEDMLILCEVKTRSKTKKATIVKEASDSIVRDYTTRLADQLLFHHIRLQQQGDLPAATSLARFFGKGVAPFQTRLVAAIVHETSLWSDDYLDKLPQRYSVVAGVEVHVTCVDNLAQWIEGVLSAAMASCDAGTP